MHTPGENNQISLHSGKVRTKHPDIAGSCETAEVDALWRHPLDRQLALACLVISVRVDPTTQTKVGQFHTVMT